MIHSLPRTVLVSLSIATLGACASGTPVVTATGRLPGEGTVSVVRQEPSHPSQADRLIETGLEERGLRPGDTPQYLAMWTRSRRPLSAGLLLPEAGTSREWLASPAPGKSGRFEDRATLTVIDAARGTLVYRAIAALRSGKPSPERDAELIGALFVQPPQANSLPVDRPAAARR